MRVCAIPEGDPASPLNFVARLRLLEPLRILASRKRLVWTCQSVGRPLSLAGQQIAIVQRACFPTARLLEDGLRSLNRARRNGTRVIYELDDHLFCPNLRSLIERSAIDEVDERSYKRHQAHKALFEVADAVICSTPALANAIRRLGVSVPIHVLPTAADFKCPRWKHIPRTRPAAGGEYRIGWSGGSRVGRDLELLVPVLQRILARHSEVTFMLAGSLKYSRLFASLPAGRFRTVEWVPYDSYPAVLAQYDLALIPWEDNAYNRCKSPLKAIDYNAVGVPVVSSAGSPCAAYVRQAIPESGCVARTLREWVDGIERFVRDRTAPAAGRRLQAWTRRRYDYRAHAALHWRILRQVADTGSGN